MKVEYSMRSSTAFVVGVLLFSSASASAHAEIAAEPEPPTPFAIADMHGFLYLRESGTLHAQDLFRAVGLWNTAAGEGIAGEPSTTMLLTIELQGQAFSKAPGKLLVIVTQGKTKLLQQTTVVSTLFSRNKHVSAPFLVNNITCGEMTVAAAWQGLPDSKAATVTKKIIMACGQ
jgi:hypothetical protein